VVERTDRRMDHWRSKIEQLERLGVVHIILSSLSHKVDHLAN